MDKKEDLLLCDNWLGISLLEVVGKVFAKIIAKENACSVGNIVYSVYS